MDKLIQNSFRSIIQYIAGNMESAKEYENLAMEEYKEHEDSIKAIFENGGHKVKRYRDKCSSYRIEDCIPKQVKKKLYEMVS